MHRRALLAFGGFSLIALLPAHVPAFGATDWPTLKRTIRNRFPEVRHVSVEELHAALAGADAPVLIDARTPGEYRVSHLQGARRAETAAQAIQALAGTTIG